jgi:hypothetical protein
MTKQRFRLGDHVSWNSEADGDFPPDDQKSRGKR